MTFIWSPKLLVVAAPWLPRLAFWGLFRVRLGPRDPRRRVCVRGARFLPCGVFLLRISHAGGSPLNCDGSHAMGQPLSCSFRSRFRQPCREVASELLGQSCDEPASELLFRESLWSGGRL